MTAFCIFFAAAGEIFWEAGPFMVEYRMKLREYRSTTLRAYAQEMCHNSNQSGKHIRHCHMHVHTHTYTTYKTHP